MKFKVLPIYCLIIIATFTLSGCMTKTNTATPSAKLKVIASVYPVYEFARQVGGDKIDLTMLLPPGAEPHDWEPTAKEIMQIKAAKIFFYHGAGFENLEKILSQKVLGETKPVMVSQNISPLPSSDNDSHVHESDSQHQHRDSHMWLDPLLAQKEVTAIAEALASADPANADYYTKNAENYNKELAILDEEYRTTIAPLTRREIITNHAAFAYLANRYQLKQLAIMGLSPDSEPTPEKMTYIVNFCRKHNVKYIFAETLISTKLSETIAKETGAKILILNPLENLTETELKQGKNYLTIMRENLANLKQALSQ